MLQARNAVSLGRADADMKCSGAQLELIEISANKPDASITSLNEMTEDLLIF